jgi:hypothetical protein
MRPMLAGAAALITLTALAGCARSQGAGMTIAMARPRLLASGPADTYLAEGQDTTGTTVQRPSCASGCPLNSLGTVVLYDMSWTQWSGSRAAGTGAATFQSCAVMCSGQPQYRTRVRITLTRPVRDCRTHQAFWTRVTLGYPDGTGSAQLPPDPWDFTALAAAARATCG